MLFCAQLVGAAAGESRELVLMSFDKDREARNIRLKSREKPREPGDDDFVQGRGLAPSEQRGAFNEARRRGAGSIPQYLMVIPAFTPLLFLPSDSTPPLSEILPPVLAPSE